MAQIHVVKRSEHISGIARKFGFRDFRIILDHPNNAALKKRRADPHVLFPGDQVFIPDRTEKVESGPTTKQHVFAIQEEPLFLRVRLRDVSDNAIKNLEYELGSDSRDQTEPGQTDGNGLGDAHELDPVKDVEGHIEAERNLAGKGEPDRTDTLDIDLRIGDLNPETTLSGQQARLNNLGYFAGYAVDDLDQMQWAIEEFQCDHMGKKPVKQTPEIKPESEDPSEVTGVQDAETRKALLKEHGV